MFGVRGCCLGLFAVRGCCLGYGVCSLVLGVQRASRCAPKPLQSRSTRTPGYLPRTRQAIMISWCTPVRQHITMLGPAKELYGVKWHSGVVRGRRPAAGVLGCACGPFGGRPWDQLQSSNLATLSSAPGVFNAPAGCFLSNAGRLYCKAATTKGPLAWSGWVGRSFSQACSAMLAQALHFSSIYIHTYIQEGLPMQSGSIGPLPTG